MALLTEGAVIADRYTAVADDAPLPDSPALVSFARLQRDGIPAGRNAPLGVALPPDASPELLAEFLPRLALVAVRLPGSRDGRAFSQARALREYHGFTGEIRATGHVIPDHLGMLRRCGVSTVEVPDGADAAVWNAAGGAIDIAYQPSLGPSAPLGLLRRRLAVA